MLMNTDKKGKLFYYMLFGLMIISMIIFFSKNKYYKPITPPSETSFQAFYQKQLGESKRLKVRPGNEEKLIDYGSPSNRVLLYIHGFGASRAEGEYVVDSLSRKWKANTYYLRLPGHGIDDEAHSKTKFSDYLVEVEEALYMVQNLGDTIVIVGTSMGGMLATYLASTYPEMVDAVILFSPFYDYANPLGTLAKVPGFINLFALFTGNERNYEPSEHFKSRVQTGYQNYWLMDQKVTAVLSLENLRSYVVNDNTYKKVKSPLALFYYYQDEDNQDGAACVKEMQYAFSKFSSPIKMKFQISDGSHVLASKYMRTDKTKIFHCIEQWNNEWIAK